MILVDTTVWIDFFSNKNTDSVLKLENHINNGVDIAICGIILTEILQGIKNIKQYNNVREILESFSFLETYRSTYIKAAEIYRKSRSKGLTIRKTIDCLIAAIAIEHRTPLLHNDKDFTAIAMHNNLEII